MSEVRLRENEMQVSCDVKKFFTNKPINATIRICDERITEDEPLSERTEMSVKTIIILLRFCLFSSTFMHGGQRYKRISLWRTSFGTRASPGVLSK